MPDLRRRLCRGRHAVGLAATLLLTVPAVGDDSAKTLVPGIPIERSLTAGGTDVFHAALEAGKPWRVRVEQLGIDVVVEVRVNRPKSSLATSKPWSSNVGSAVGSPKERSS